MLGCRFEVAFNVQDVGLDISVRDSVHQRERKRYFYIPNFHITINSTYFANENS